MTIRYEVKYQLGVGTHTIEMIVETTSINMGFVQCAVRAQSELPKDAEIVAITFWAVQ